MPHDDRTYFLTGATGFLGAFILAELLDRTGATVHCLVRAADDADGADRIRGAMTEFRTWRDEYATKIVPVPGDLTKPLLGIPEDRFSQLAREVDVIYHAGAQVNFVYPYAALKAANVGGTQEVIRLAVRDHVKPVHHVSAVDAMVKLGLVSVKEDDPLPASPIPHGYVQSKWAAERAVAAAQAKGLPVSIYRPWLVGAHTTTGVCHTTDYVLRLLHGCLEAGVVPNHEEDLNISPVDFFSRALVHISLDDNNLGKPYHLANPIGEPLVDLYARIRSFGYGIEELPYEAWRDRLHRTLQPESPAYSVLPLIPERPAPEGARHPSIDCTRTFAALEGTDITCARLDEQLAHRQLSYLVDIGFLPAPDRALTAVRS
ncbi:thioester reductase domain-containing protein [Lentzea kentuckyensis]|uniref:thioester reductase domain-containing protein n=1 Tax=Lentzea kentuckyensis TaxID=360086 RepID=UPI0013021E05|nr:thioester reductase domain-containing protein [Lentzea kentuckyensis]